ncbi:hypothetical protein Pyn_04536 [Prunus yedoensis var. nudiflora]|uniref:Uncharacterized protein n=1 Tax=Prunus yedoensis var. nudiflora TaxID=2094558 RepID=A0A314UGK8_PRUYE|nr:hypothetical protein Pyn_04536 [Prunus yedoensis var. nudiflora]
MPSVVYLQTTQNKGNDVSVFVLRYNNKEKFATVTQRKQRLTNKSRCSSRWVTGQIAADVSEGKKQFAASFDDAADVLGKSTSLSGKANISKAIALFAGSLKLRCTCPFKGNFIMPNPIRTRGLLPSWMLKGFQCDREVNSYFTLGEGFFILGCLDQIKRHLLLAPSHKRISWSKGTKPKLIGIGLVHISLKTRSKLLGLSTMPSKHLQHKFNPRGLPPPHPPHQSATN